MKLISMTEFVLEQSLKNEDTTFEENLNIIQNYAKFLKQPLKLEMFICSITEPEVQGGYAEDGTFVGGYDEKWIEEYYEAKDKVLFKGFDLSTAKYHCDRNDRKIEYFTSFEVELTPNAIKRIFG